MRFNQMGLYLYMLDDLERGMELVKRGMDLVGEVASASQPAMMTWPYFMDHYRNERYEAALEETHKMEILRFWGTHVFVAAASARLELKTEMQAAVTELLQLRPNFAEKAEESIRNLITSKDVTDQLIDGLRKAGLDIPNGPVFDV